MSRRREGNLFIGRLSKNVRVRDLEDVFEPYGRMTRCEVKYGAQMGKDSKKQKWSTYGFVDYEDQRDAEDALRYENGRDLCGANIRVEWAKGAPRGTGGGPPPRGGSVEECYQCHRMGHFARDCRSSGYGGGGGYRSSKGGGGRYRSPSPRRRRRSRSRSRDRKRSRSRSRDRRRDRSTSRDRKKNDSVKSASRSRSKSSSRSKSKSRSKSPDGEMDNGDD